MKKSLTILTIAILAIVAFAGFVNAASVDVSPTNVQKVEAGETVSVTVNFAKTTVVKLKLAYNPEYFECISKSGDEITSVNTNTSGVVGVTNMGNLTSVTLQFKALKTVDATQQFNLTELDIGSDVSDDATASGSLVITPAEETTPPAGDQDTGSGNQGGGNGSESSETEVPVDKKGNPITEIDNAGTPVFAGVIALIVIAGAVLVIKNRK